MTEASVPVSSRQTQPHPRLAETVAKHAATKWRKPVAEHSRRTFDALVHTVGAAAKSCVLDTGCGTGMSTAVLARRFPNSLVLGVDKSLARLGKAPSLPENARLIRMDLEDLWL